MVGWSINIIEADGAQEKKVNIASLHKMTIAQVYPKPLLQEDRPIVPSPIFC